MKDIAFIIPYFGKFNNYFQLFLYSCKNNPNCDWIIFTDDKEIYDYPNNVKVHYCEFEEIKSLFVTKFNCNVNLSRPYKLCDFKPMYGYVFEKYLVNYRFWGYCDVDMIFGKVDHFITPAMLDMYDKIGIMGHCTIFRNSYEINRLFMHELNGRMRYLDILKEEKNHSFDEEFNLSINNIFEEYNMRINYNEYEANIYTKSSNFWLTKMNEDRKTYSIEKEKNLFVWDNGNLFRYQWRRGAIIQDEFMYIHMQSRPMKNKLKEPYPNRYKLIPNAFDVIEVKNISRDNYAEIKLKYFNLHYFKLRGKNAYLKLRKRWEKCKK